MSYPRFHSNVGKDYKREAASKVCAKTKTCQKIEISKSYCKGKIYCKAFCNSDSVAIYKGFISNEEICGVNMLFS